MGNGLLIYLPWTHHRFLRGLWLQEISGCGHHRDGGAMAGVRGGEQRERSDPGRGMPGVPAGQGRVPSCRDLPSTCKSFQGLSWWPVLTGNGNLQERPIPGSVSVEVQVRLQIGSSLQVLFYHPDSRPCTRSHPGFLPGRSIRGNQEGYRRVISGGLPCAAGCLGSASGSGWSP